MSATALTLPVPGVAAVPLARVRLVGCPGLACAACGMAIGCQRLAPSVWAWTHATLPATTDRADSSHGSVPGRCPGPVLPPLGVVYLLHVIPPFRHARHYLGFAATSAILPRRLRKHATGKGATLLRAARAAGCDFELVRLWPGTRSLERQFKQRKAAPRLLCPLCRAHRRLAATAGQGTLLDPTSYLDLGGWSR